MKRGKGPQFTRFFKPIIEVLQEIGGSGTASEVIDRAIEKMHIPESEQEITVKSGISRVRNQVQFARLHLVKLGYLDSSKRGVWSLTEKGLMSFSNVKDIKALSPPPRSVISGGR